MSTAGQWLRPLRTTENPEGVINIALEYKPSIGVERKKADALKNTPVN